MILFRTALIAARRSMLRNGAHVGRAPARARDSAGKIASDGPASCCLGALHDGAKLYPFASAWLLGRLSREFSVWKEDRDLEAHTRSPRDLFDGKPHYEIPLFQRPYVWNEEDQWAPLWDDVIRVAESYVAAKDAGTASLVPHHFLGAIVYESMPPVVGDVTRHNVIDGQQRMTTLQLLLDAVQQVFSERGHELMAESLEDLILNKNAAFKGKRERFKLWPSQADRDAFSHVMGHQGDAWSGEHRMIEAHAFFREEAEQWISGAPDSDGAIAPGNEELRVEALSSTLQNQLQIVAIDLTGHDDAQLIFETLNNRGTPLLKADLIKNWVFRRGETLKADVEKWSETYWADFDNTWWRDEISQGRLNRSRIDSFLQYWLTMNLQEEVKAEHVFRAFADYAAPLMKDSDSASDFLSALRKDADTYQGFAQLDKGATAGRFYSRVIETMELAATTPVFLWLLSENNGVPDAQRRLGLDAIESWVIRRTLLRFTTKDVNKFMVALLKMLNGTDPASSGAKIRTYLSEQTADTRYWPSDEQLIEQLPDMKLYANIRQGRLLVILEAVEQYLRGQSPKYGAVGLPSGLEIEHIMPRGWRTHWDPAPKLQPVDASQRDKYVNTIGNLTLVTKSLNGSLSNRPWTDPDSAPLKEGGRPGQGKRTILDDFNLLVVNKKIIDSHPTAWTDGDIIQRSKEMAVAIADVWPGPSAEVQQAAFEESTS